MKKQLLLFAMIVLPVITDAQTAEIDGIYYNIVTKAKEAEVISNPNKYTGNVDIPVSVTYEGVEYTVTSIKKNAFYNCIDLISVTIPNSVLNIGEYAFYKCSRLTSVTISNSVSNIKIGTFSGCSGLRSVSIPYSVKRLEGGYDSDKKGYYGAFSGCSSLTSVLIPDSITTIGDFSFSGCSSLTSITLPNSVTIIGECAFMNCSGLTSVLIPNNVTSIKRGTFCGCSSLTSITIPNSVTSIQDGYDSRYNLYRGAFQNCSSLTTLTIPNSVMSIGNFAFYGCSSLKSISIPYNIGTIRRGTFYGCVSLTNVAIPNSVISIESGYDSFYNSYAGAFQYCKGLMSMTIPNSVTSIGVYAFYGCSGLCSVTIGSGIKSIQREAFASCKDLTDVYCMVDNVPNTSTDAFRDSYIEYATLHVPASTAAAYSSIEPWKNFMKIITLDGEEIQETSKCVTPTIAYIDGKLVFDCETEDVDFVSEIKTIDQKKLYDKEVSLTPPITTITVYATKTGFDNSDVATATIGWRNGSPILEGFSCIKLNGTETNGDVNGDGTIDVADIAAIISLMAGK